MSRIAARLETRHRFVIIGIATVVPNGAITLSDDPVSTSAKSINAPDATVALLSQSHCGRSRPLLTYVDGGGTLPVPTPRHAVIVRAGKYVLVNLLLVQRNQNGLPILDADFDRNYRGAPFTTTPPHRIDKQRYTSRTGAYFSDAGWTVAR
jgi:hypothetical protein